MKPEEAINGAMDQEPTFRFYLGRLYRQISFKQIFTSLRYPNYRIWFWGQLISLFGTWMQVTAQGFLVYELTGSSAYLGLVGFAAGIPSWIFMPYGGVIADRMSRRTLLLVTQTSMMILAFALASLTFFGLVQPWHVLILALALGVANAFDAPARHAFVPELVDREDLTNAIALNSTIFNSATAVGPAASGIAYAVFGPAWCFTINGISFVAVIAALLRMKLKPVQRPQPISSSWHDLKEGFRYVISHPMIRTLVGLVVVTSLFGVSFAVLLPAWAVQILHGNATTNGWLQSARGVGALIGALFVASLGRFNFKGKMLMVGTVAFPLTIFVFALMRWLPLSLFFLVGTGVSALLIFNLANALVQTLVKDSLRGRVMGLYSLTFFGFLPVGALWVGMMAQHFGEITAVTANAGILIAFSIILWAFIPKLRGLE